MIRSASPLAEGERIEVRGSGHTIASCSTLTLPSPLIREKRTYLVEIVYGISMIAVDCEPSRRERALREVCDAFARQVPPAHFASCSRVRDRGGCIRTGRDMQPACVMKFPCGGGEGAVHSSVVASHGLSFTFSPCLMLQKKLMMNGI